MHNENVFFALKIILRFENTELFLFTVRKHSHYVYIVSSVKFFLLLLFWAKT